MKEAFGDGNDYDWALEIQEREEEGEKHALDSEDPELSPRASSSKMCLSLPN